MSATINVVRTSCESRNVTEPIEGKSQKEKELTRAFGIKEVTILKLSIQFLHSSCHNRWHELRKYCYIQIS